MNDALKTWLNSQYPWLKIAASRLLSNGQLSEEDFDFLISAIKEPESMPPIVENYPHLGGAEETQNLELISLGDFQGIDCLAPRSPLVFAKDKITVIYGENGAGKSGYTRTLKNLCGKRNAPHLQRNVFADDVSEQSCEVSFITGEVAQTIQWNVGDNPVLELSGVDIFDSLSGKVYLEQEAEASYIPAELNFYTELVSVCETLDSRLASEEAKLISTLPQVPSNIAETNVIRKAQAINAKTTEANLEKLTRFSEDDDKELERLRKLLSDNDFAKQIKESAQKYSRLQEIYEKLTTALESCRKQSVEGLSALRDDAKSKRKAVVESAAILGDITQFSGIGEDTWRTMWDAARAFSQIHAYPEQPFPKTADAKCVLCHQDLNDEAAERLIKFEEFIASKLEAEAKSLERKYSKALESLPVCPVEDVLKTSCEAAALDDETTKQLENVWLSIHSFVSLLKSDKLSNELVFDVESSEMLVSKLKNEVAKRNEKLASLREEQQNFDREEVIVKGRELAAQKWCFEQSEALSNELTRQRKLTDLKEWRKQTKTRAITQQANAASEALLTDAYVSRFNEELKKLGAQKISVELKRTRATKGVVKHALCLKGIERKATQAVSILSEGENRVVALAAFLADVTGSQSKTPFVFDDPISSLDQRFEEKTVSRLIELSANRQVIVFTHRLSLLGLLSEKGKERVTNIKIRREPWGTGEPTELSLFEKKPENALNKIKDSRLSSARKTREQSGEDGYYPLAKAICSDLRILMERIVEIYLLGDVIQRHRRAVNTVGKLPRLTKITEGDCQVVDDFMTKYSAFEHSQPGESPVELPEPDEIETDIAGVSAWLDEFIKREPKSK